MFQDPTNIYLFFASFSGELQIVTGSEIWEPFSYIGFGIIFSWTSEVSLKLCRNLKEH